MKKRILLVLTALTLSVCGCSKDTTKKDLKEFTHDSYGDVELCEYKGIATDKPVYEVTQEDIDSYIDSLLYDYAETTVVERGAKDGDCLALTFTISCDGEILYDYSDEEYYTYIGYEEFGAEFDQKLIGLKAGDNSKFSITYADDYSDTELAGKTIDYDVNVHEVSIETYPELTDEFITEDLGYDSYDNMVDEITKELEEENQTESEYSAKENIIQNIIDNSTFNKYSDELYESCKQSTVDEYAEYSEMFGCSTTEELYEIFGMTDEDVEFEIMNQVYRIIVIDAISQKEDLALTNTEFNNGVLKYTEDFGYDTSEDLITEYGEDTLYTWILEDKVLNFLVENAELTEVEYTEDDFEEE